MLEAVLVLAAAVADAFRPRWALLTCCRPLPRRTAPPQVAFGVACCLRHHDGSSASGTFYLSGPLLGVHSSLRPAHSLTPPSGALSVGFADGISLAGATQAMRLRPFSASGLSPYGPMGTSRHHTATISSGPPLMRSPAPLASG